MTRAGRLKNDNKGEARIESENSNDLEFIIIMYHYHNPFFVALLLYLNHRLIFHHIVTTTKMDGETPSWLEADSAAPEPTPAPVPEPTPEPETFDLNHPPPSSDKTARAPTTDNIAGSILNNAKTSTDAPQNEVDESDLPKMIFVMRLLNLAAAGLLIAVSVRFTCHNIT